MQNFCVYEVPEHDSSVYYHWGNRLRDLYFVLSVEENGVLKLEDMFVKERGRLKPIACYSVTLRVDSVCL
jgi:hypothetical protein